MPLANDHGLARDTGSHLIGTEWQDQHKQVWTVTQAMYGVLRLRIALHFNHYVGLLFYTEDELRREMREVTP